MPGDEGSASASGAAGSSSGVSFSASAGGASNAAASGAGAGSDSIFNPTAGGQRRGSFRASVEGDRSSVNASEDLAKKEMLRQAFEEFARRVILLQIYRLRTLLSLLTLYTPMGGRILIPARYLLCFYGDDARTWTRTGPSTSTR